MSPPFLTSPVLAAVPVRHGFFTRDGGVSEGAFRSNNMSLSQGDDADAVEANRAGVAGGLGRHRDALVLLRQVHSTDVVVVAAHDPDAAPVVADAMVTARPGLLLGILTADCAPVLLADTEAGVIGAAHAGWKGAAGGIVRRTLSAMVGLGAEPARVRAAIGPTISGASYEIGPETAAAIVALDPAAAAHVFVPEGGGREHFDIPGFLVAQLRTAGVAEVADIGRCTYAEPAEFFSHRWATHHGTATGRQVSIIGLP